MGLTHGSAETILVVGVYLKCGDEAAAASQLEDVLQCCLQSRFRFVIVGDFNLTQEHGTLLEYAASGCIRCADECRPGECLPATGPVCRGSRRRRIDFALQQSGLQAEQVHHAEGHSDHLIVSYDCLTLRNPGMLPADGPCAPTSQPPLWLRNLPSGTQLPFRPPSRRLTST